MNTKLFFKELYIFQMNTSKFDFNKIFIHDDGHLWDSLIYDCKWDILKFYNRLDLENQMFLENHIDNQIKKRIRIKKLNNVLSRY